jgi:uncharacterized protein YijF (DUF1287 family)
MRFLLVVLLAVQTVAARPPHSTIADAAVAQVGVTTIYDPAYVHLRYPGGDVPRERGVCSDVVVRAFRGAGVLDLQQAVHEDMAAHFGAYPKMWAMRGADANIDHRRVPNLMKFFERRGKSRALGDAYEPGDVVAWRLPNGLYHVGVVSPTTSATARGTRTSCARGRSSGTTAGDHGVDGGTGSAPAGCFGSLAHFKMIDFCAAESSRVIGINPGESSGRFRRLMISFAFVTTSS